jgi:hypothetical protein
MVLIGRPRPHTPDNKMKKRTKVLDTKEAEGPEVGPLLERERWEGLAARIMNLGPYELATLAARICPELCLKSPVEAIGKAKELLSAVTVEDWVSDARLVAAMKEKMQKRRCPYKEGIKIITGEDRPDRAEDYFGRFLEYKHSTKKAATAALSVYEAKGFTEAEVVELQKEFVEWWPQHRRKKGKQGHVKNPEEDKRTKPRPAGIQAMRKAIIGDESD